MDFNKTTQKQLTEIDKRLLLGFKTTSNLKHSLTSLPIKKTPVHPALLFSNGKTKVYIEQAEKELAIKARDTSSKEKFLLESDVKSLSSNPKPESNPRTQQMIAKQKESRRKRHIDFLDEFDKVIEALYKNTDGNCVGIKKEIELFFHQSDKAINNYLDSLTDSELLTREIEFIDDLNKTIKEHQEKRSDKLFSLYNLLHGQETERQNTISLLCDKLNEDLFETAFILEDEVNKLVKGKQSSLEKSTEEFVEKNKLHLESFNKIQLDAFEKFEEMSHLKEKRWRFLKHEEALRNFRTDIQDLKFVNPPNRVLLFQELKKQHVAFFKQRELFLKKLEEIEFSSVDKGFVESLIDEYQKFVSKTNETYDKLFDDLLKEHEKTQEKAKKLLNQLISRLETVKADIETSVTEIIQEECQPFLTNLDQNGKNVLSQAIKFVEDSDSKSNDIILNILNLLLKIGNKFDDNKKEILNDNQTYEIEKAKLADSNDDNIESLNQNFEALKVELQQSLHHPQLEQNLVKVFEKIDELEKEYRDFHLKNVELARKHPRLIEDLFSKFEIVYAQFFELVELSKKEELQQRNLKRAQDKVAKLIVEEENARLKEEERLIEESKKKGGKAPPSKPKQKDPKKAAQELELKQKELLEKVGIEQLEFFDTPMGNKFIFTMSSKEYIEKKFYIPLINEEDKKIEENKEKNEENKEDGKELPVDYKNPSPIDTQNIAILDINVVFPCETIQKIFTTIRKKVFEYINFWKNKNLNENTSLDKDFIEDSILILDERLKLHYPLKGKMEVEIFSTRSAQITEHKKKYERHTRSSLQKMNLQSEEFNYLLEECLNDLKSYESDQSNLRDALPNAMSLPKLQGILNTVRENFYKFNEKILTYKEHLELLSESEMNSLLKQNVDFIEGSKLFEEGGNYSSEEVKWYENMLKEIDEQIKQNQTQRQNKAKDIIELMNKKKQEMLDLFEKQYAISIEELACREGTGKKYGRPRRLFQERIRAEMTKCEKAQEGLKIFRKVIKFQIGINNNIEKLRILYKKFIEIKESSDHSPFYSDPSFSLKVRQILNRIRTCISKYSKHISALKPDAKAQEMPRVSYNELKFDISVDAQEAEKDKILKEEELEELGPLYFQKEQKNFMEWFVDIEKNVREEAQKIYVGVNVKFLTGADKIPDYLRTYLINMKKQSEDFRISCVRYLRNSCDEISKFSKEISQTVLESVFLKYIWIESNQKNILEGEFAKIFEENEKTKTDLTFKLRPNLSNPSCKEELDSVCESEQARNQKIMSNFIEYKEKLLENCFGKASDFFKAVINNFEFLLMYFDNLLLFEDFIKLPGDEEIIKKHDSLKTLLKRKQKGTLIDTSSERSISKIWPGILVNSFNIGNKKVEYAVASITTDAKNEKNTKNIKKEKDVVAEVEKTDETTREVKSFKTYRQKAAVKYRNVFFENYKKKFDEEVAEIQNRFNKLQYEEQKYQFYWDQKVFKLKNPDIIF